MIMNIFPKKKKKFDSDLSQLDSSESICRNKKIDYGIIQSLHNTR